MLSKFILTISIVIAIILIITTIIIATTSFFISMFFAIPIIDFILMIIIHISFAFTCILAYYLYYCLFLYMFFQL